MASALDSQKRRVSVAATCPRHREYAPRAVATVDQNELLPAVRMIVARIEDGITRHGTGAYVFIAPDLRAYVLTEDQSCTQAWVREHFAWVVGFYSRRKVDGIPLLVPTLAGVCEDVGEHLEQLGVRA